MERFSDEVWIIDSRCHPAFCGTRGRHPYLPKPGEKTLSMRVSTCAVSGGVHPSLHRLDNGLFDKYGIKLENVFIRGSAQNLTRAGQR